MIDRQNGIGERCRELDAVDGGEHFPPDQALPVTEVEDLSEELGDYLAEAGNKGGQCGEVRGAIAALVVAITVVEQGKVELVVEQVMHGMLETARQQLFLQISRQEARAGVDGL